MKREFILFNYVVNNASNLTQVKDITLLKGYHQIFEQYPGLHPDGFDDVDSGWPEHLRPICAEMWRRVDVKESIVSLEHMYYLNKAFRNLASESANRSISDCFRADDTIIKS